MFCSRSGREAVIKPYRLGLKWEGDGEFSLRRDCVKLVTNVNSHTGCVYPFLPRLITSVNLQ